MRPVVAAGVLVPLAVLVVAAVLGILLGAAWAVGALAIGLVVVAAAHLRQIGRLTRWADGALDGPVPEAGGAWGYAFSALHRRVRARERHQNDLAMTIERFRSAVEALPDGMVVVDAANRIEWANARAQAQLGFDLPRDAGRPLLNFVRQPEVIRYFETGDFDDAVVVPSLREPGVTLSLQVIPFGIDQRLLISRNITQLEALARMRRDFIANVSHELKTPLTVVAGFVETLQDMALGARQRERYLELMAEQTRSMQRLVDDLLTLSALEGDQSPLAESAFAVGPLLRELATEAMSLSAGRHPITIDEGDPAIVTGSRDELRSAFGNLVSNAIRYTPAGGTIALAWRIDDDGRGAFSVADNGIGIAPEHIPRLTERFYRVDRSRSRATGGTGLGLAIVKHVLLRHQAELDVVSEPGQGSTFAVLLPARRVQRITRAEGSGGARARSTPEPTATSS